MARKFVIASMLHETNTFSPLSTPIESFGPGGPLKGEAAICSEATVVMVAAIAIVAIWALQ